MLKTASAAWLIVTRLRCPTFAAPPVVATHARYAVRIVCDARLASSVVAPTDPLCTATRCASAVPFVRIVVPNGIPRGSANRTKGKSSLRRCSSGQSQEERLGKHCFIDVGCTTRWATNAAFSAAFRRLAQPPSHGIHNSLDDQRSLRLGVPSGQRSLPSISAAAVPELDEQRAAPVRSSTISAVSIPELEEQRVAFAHLPSRGSARAQLRPSPGLDIDAARRTPLQPPLSVQPPLRSSHVILHRCVRYAWLCKRDAILFQRFYS